LSKRARPEMPVAPFAFLLVEGGDEREICKWLIGDAAWPSYCCWPADGRDDIPVVAAIAARDPNFGAARSIGIVLDTESSIADAQAIAAKAFQAFQLSLPGHALISTDTLKHGVFYSPDGTSFGAIENLCRSSAAHAKVAACVDSLERCVNDSNLLPALVSKRWVEAYIAFAGNPRHQLRHAVTEGLFGPGAFAELKAFLLAL